MPLIAGLALAGMLAFQADDDLLGNNQYAVVKQVTHGGKAQSISTSEQACDIQGKPAKLSEVPILHDLFVAPVPAVAGVAATAPVDLIALAQLFTTNSAGLSKIAAYQKKVSVNFNDASATDVFKWLGKQGVNFVGATSSLPKAKLSMSFTNTPLHEVLDSIGEALGGGWQVKGSTIVFRQGYRFDSIAPLSAPARPLGKLRTFERAPLMREVPKIAPGTIREYKLSEEVKKAMDLAVIEAEKAFKEARIQMDKISGDEMKKAMEESARAMEKSRKALAESRVRMDESSLAMRESARDFKKFLETLTPAQKELHKKQGFLKPSDLTKEQRALLKLDNLKGEFKLQYQVDNQPQVIIKN